MSAFRTAASILIVSLCTQAAGLLKVWATDKACPAMTTAVSEIARVPFPQGWAVLVACNEMQWEKLQRRADAQATQSAFTNVTGKITVVRGTIFLQTVGARSARRVLLHEIGHIQCNCGDEWEAEAWAIWYERGGTHGRR